MKRWLFLIWVMLLIAPQPTFSQDDSIRIHKFAVQATEGGYVYNMPPGKQSQKIRIKWPETIKSVPLRIEWLATARRLDMKTYINNQEIAMKGEVESRQITYKDTNCDEYKGTFQIEKSGNKDFVIQVDLVKINTNLVVSSFVVEFLVPKPMSYELKKSIQEIFNFHRNASKAEELFEKARGLRRKIIEDLRKSLSEAEVEIARLKREKTRLRKLLEGKYEDVVKQLRAEKNERDIEIARLSKLLQERMKDNIQLKSELEKLRLLIKDRNPPEIEILFPKAKEAGKYVAHQPEVELQGMAKDESNIAWIKVNKKEVKFKEVVTDDGKKVGAQFSCKIPLSADQENSVEISAKDSAGNIRTESYIIVRKIPVIKEYLCNKCRYRINTDTKFCPNCGYPETEPMAKNIVEKRFLCKGCDLSSDLHHHIRIVRRKKKDIDKTPPQIAVLFPTPNLFVSNKVIEVKGTVQDNIRVDQVLVNGKAAKVEKGNFSLSVTLGKEGPQTLEIEASDTSENKTKKSIPITLDLTPPVVKITAPAWKYVFTPKIEVKGVVQEQNLDTLTVNKLPGKVDGQGNFSVEISVGPQVKNIEVVARDKGGNTAVVQKQIVFKARAKGDDQFEPNDSIREAFPLKVGFYKDLICRTPDWYKIKVSKPSILRVRIFFVHKKGDLELKLYSPTGQILAQSTSSMDDEMLEKDLPKGDYFIQIYRYQKSKAKFNNYDLFIKTIPLAEPLPGLSYIGQNAGGYHEYLHKASGITLVLIPAVKYWMGSPNTEDGRDTDEGPRHAVYLDSYLIGKYEVTQKQWQAVMKNNPSNNKRSENLPVEEVNWQDAMTFCKKVGMTIPTEAQWERACRAEEQPSTTTSTLYYWGNQMNDKYCWYRSNASAQTQEVGKTLPNQFGLCDMLGNVREWCLDWYVPYTSTMKRNPTGPSQGTRKVNRGGAAGSMSQNCRSATRYGSDPNRKSFMIGLRVALPLLD